MISFQVPRERRGFISIISCSTNSQPLAFTSFDNEGSSFFVLRILSFISSQSFFTDAVNNFLSALQQQFPGCQTAQVCRFSNRNMFFKAYYLSSVRGQYIATQ